MEGGIGYGLGAVLFNEITLGEGGRVVQSNFHDYRSLRINEMPEVEVRVIRSTEKPTGVGEPGVPPIGPAVANAWRALTGEPMRRLPFSRCWRRGLHRGEDMARHRGGRCGGTSGACGGLVSTGSGGAGRGGAETGRGLRRMADERRAPVALFTEAGKVLQHPRCLNCHPAGDVPLQGMEMTPHQPPVVRGEAGFRRPGMTCTTCHARAMSTLVAQADDLKSVPGHPEWHLAPIEMAWVDRSLGQICEQIKDPQRNGGKTIAEIVDHMAHDSLVGWGWAPGEGREPAPGTQEAFGALFEAWAAAGAHCPPA